MTGPEENQAPDEWVEVPIYLQVGTFEQFQIGTATGPLGRTWSRVDTAELLEAMARGFRRDMIEGDDG